MRLLRYAMTPALVRHTVHLFERCPCSMCACASQRTLCLARRINWSSHGCKRSCSMFCTSVQACMGRAHDVPRLTPGSPSTDADRGAPVRARARRALARP